VQKTEAEMLRTKNFGRKSLNEIKEILAGMGLQFGMKFDSLGRLISTSGAPVTPTAPAEEEEDEEEDRGEAELGAEPELQSDKEEFENLTE